MKEKKLMPGQELKQKIRDLKAEGKKVVFTNGCFDLIHIGHVRLLQMAKSKGDFLVVALNSDDSIRKIKGSKRPLLDESQRGRILAAFESVDFVTFFDEDTPLDLIREMKPDVLVKGGDYEIEEIVGRQEVWDNGGEVLLFKPVKNRSTSAIMKDIVERFK